MKTVVKFLLLLTLAWILPSCATKKRRDDLSALGKLYHNTTSKFNGYYNANVLLNESILKLNEQQKDNYNQVLPVYEYMAAPNPQSVAPELDEAIKKVSIVISLHRQSHWTDDCYLLIGQSQFLKGDFESAEETFRYLLDEFPPDSKSSKSKTKKTELSKRERKKLAKEERKAREREKKERKKEIERKRKERKKLEKARRKRQEAKRAGKDVKDIPPPTAPSETKPEEEQPVSEQQQEEEADIPTSPPSYFLKHRPVYQEGLLWYARTLVERGKPEEARRVFMQLETDPATFNDVRRDLQPAIAYAAIKEKNYNQAIQYLESAILTADEKPQKARYAYIVAQIQQKLGRSSDAYANFQRVLKYRPTYEMEFNATLQMAQNAWATGKASPQEISDDLSKMLKDIKNQEFQDRIYYTLAQIALQNNEKEKAIENLRLSLSHSTGNTAQMTESYYQLAKLYHEDEDYVQAKLYYDSTLAVIPQTDERYQDVRLYSANLTDIAKNIQIIQLQDSLLRISRMTPEEQKELALKIKKQEEEERIQAALAAANAGNDKSSPNKRRNFAAPSKSTFDIPGSVQVNNNATAIGDFFAYDDRAVRRGKREFQQKWNNRPLVDNWRVQSKIQEDIAAEEEEEKEEQSFTRGISDEEVKQILADVPSNPVEIASSKKAIQGALFNLGKLFREKLDNNEKAVGYLEELLERFPDTDYKKDAYYYLYLCYTDLGNKSKANEYRDKILDEFSDSMYANVLRNPNYFKDSENKERKLNDYYDNTFAAFNAGNYGLAYDRTSKADSLFGVDNPLRARFALLSAMCLGNLQGKDAYIGALKDVIAKYPNTQEQGRAKEILRLLGDESQYASIDDGEDNESTGNENESSFTREDDQLHYILIALQPDADLNKAKNQVGDYHSKYHKLDNLRASNIYLGDPQKDKNPLIVVRRFKHKDDAMKYYNGVQKNKNDFLSLDFKYQVYPITQNNYREVLKARSLDGYDIFFKENYLK